MGTPCLHWSLAYYTFHCIGFQNNSGSIEFLKLVFTGLHKCAQNRSITNNWTLHYDITHYNAVCLVLTPLSVISMVRRCLSLYAIFFHSQVPSKQIIGLLTCLSPSFTTCGSYLRKIYPPVELKLIDNCFRVFCTQKFQWSVPFTECEPRKPWRKIHEASES